MSDTIKELPRTWFRYPKGRKQALINDVRKAAIPPDEWDDLPFDKQVSRKPYKLIRRMKTKKIPDEEIIQKLQKKFNVSEARARELVEFCI